MIRVDKLVIEVVNITSAWKYGDWFKDLMGTRFVVSSYSITNAEYGVFHDDSYKVIPEKAVKVVEGGL